MQLYSHSSRFKGGIGKCSGNTVLYECLGGAVLLGPWNPYPVLDLMFSLTLLPSAPDQTSKNPPYPRVRVDIIALI